MVRDPWDPAAASFGAPPRALSAGRVPQPVRRRLQAWRVVGGGACVPTSPSVTSRRRTEGTPRASRPPSPPGEFDWERLGNRVSRPLICDRRGAGRACIVCQGWWQVCRHSTRPVLKHGPRSLTCARVIGRYETQRRSESEGRLSATQVGSSLPRAICGGWRTTGPSRLRRQWGGARACTLGPERW